MTSAGFADAVATAQAFAAGELAATVLEDASAYASAFVGVDDAALVQPDVPAVIGVAQVEDTRLPAHADELNDIGKVKLGERTLKGHEIGTLAGTVKSYDYRQLA